MEEIDIFNMKSYAGYGGCISKINILTSWELTKYGTTIEVVNC
jgi:hypothetical protein